jgi:hypothetical protein
MTDKTVSHAIERGIDFLFANRLFCGNEPRLWEDFDLLLGASDEWVTAYAARALLHTKRREIRLGSQRSGSCAIDRAKQHRKGVDRRVVHRSFFDYAPIGKQKLFSEHPVCQRL